LQGARLTSWELNKAGLDVTLLTDNMAAHIMSQGLIDLVITGTDRVAANGDVANKIGTHGVAILAKHFGIPFYVACPYSTIDFNTAEGKDIVIEEREAEEVLHFGLRRTAPEEIKVRNPAFDVTPHELVTGLITEKGIIQAPFAENLRQEYL
jgi:methylthioribose-1-phosphate isomerase